MPASTNRLVIRSRRLALPGSLAAAALLGSTLLLHGAHASAIANPMPLDDNSVAALTSLDHAMETLAARVTPSVVNVAVVSRGNEEMAEQEGGGGNQMNPQDLPPELRRFFGLGNGNGPGARPEAQPLEHGIGSGVIISPDGYIVTNNHVVDGAVNIKVTLHDRRVLSAKVIGTDKLTDLAVIKVDARDLPSISWGDSASLHPGQTVLAFGSPFGYLQFSVTRGIVSAINRRAIGNDPRTPGGLIQTDAAVNPGNSGGPLVNARGELVGINFLIATNSGSFAGASFAIPSDTVHAVADQIIKSGAVHHGYLGISMNDVTPENAEFFHLKEANGAIVAQVAPGSPAASAGLERGDVITGLNGHDVPDGGALQSTVAEMLPGTHAELRILRDGTAKTVPVTVGEYHKDTETASADSDTPGKGGKLGVSMAELTPELRQQLEVPENVKGGAVEQVRSGSPAEDAGLAPGDVIVEVNRKPTPSASDVVASVKGAPGNKDMLLLVWSRGGESYRVVRPAQG